MTSNIDAAIFLPGHIADGTEPINVPMMGIEQITTLLNLYQQNYYTSFFPYLTEALLLLRAEHVCDKTPLINKWIPVLRGSKYKELDDIISLLLIKYGWDIPQNVFDRVAQYAHLIDHLDNNEHKGHSQQLTYSRRMSQTDFELSRILNQLGQSHCMDHLIYIADYCIDVIKKVPELKTNELMELLLNKATAGMTPSYVGLYHDCVKLLVNTCVLSSYIDTVISVPNSVLDSNVFRMCLLQQPMDLLDYYCGDISIIDRFHAGIGKKLPDYSDQKTLAILMAKVFDSGHYHISMPMIGIPEIHKPTLSRYYKTALGMNPSIGDYEKVLKHTELMSQAWYCGGLACSQKLQPEGKRLILKSLSAIWRMCVNNSHIPLGYIVEIAKRIGANSDDILESTFSMRMTNVSWALKDMPKLYEIGLQIGPHTTHMISMFVIKHASKSQSITGLQKMTEVLNGEK